MLPAESSKAYDIRGIVGKTLAHGIVLQIGCATLDRGQRSVAIGHDGRLSGPELATALACGIRLRSASLILAQALQLADDADGFANRHFYDFTIYGISSRMVARTMNKRTTVGAKQIRDHHL